METRLVLILIVRSSVLDALRDSNRRREEQPTRGSVNSLVRRLLPRVRPPPSRVRPPPSRGPPGRHRME